MLTRPFQYQSPRLRYLTDEENGGPSATPTDQQQQQQPDPGFPQGVATAEMTLEQQIAYWKHHSRKHEANARPADYDALKARAAKADELEDANKSDQQKALDDARRNGELIGAERYLAAAVQGELRALTGKTSEELAGALDLIDVSKLTTDGGDLDLPKITAFAATLGLATAPSSTNTPATDPVKDAFGRPTSHAPISGGSIAELTRQAIADITANHPSK